VVLLPRPRFFEPAHVGARGREIGDSGSVYALEIHAVVHMSQEFFIS